MGWWPTAEVLSPKDNREVYCHREQLPPESEHQTRHVPHSILQNNGICTGTCGYLESVWFLRATALGPGNTWGHPQTMLILPPSGDSDWIQSDRWAQECSRSSQKSAPLPLGPHPWLKVSLWRQVTSAITPQWDQARRELIGWKNQEKRDTFACMRDLRPTITIK